MLCGLNNLSYADSTVKPTNEFDHTWLATALKMQREIDLTAPLNEATFIGTHNSYNSESYQSPFGTYLDPNQTLSLYDQLELGIRSIELDAHWTWNDSFSKDILLCHGQSNHLGCSPFDRPFSLGLQELHKWLSANPGEIVLLYIERHLDGNDSKLASQLEKHLGNFIFKPTLVRGSNENHSCISLPTKTTKADILRSGKQLIIVTKGCESAHQEPFLNDYVFAGIGAIPEQELKFSFIDSTVTSFKAYPDCSKSNLFAPDFNHTSLWRIFEDRTILGSIIKPEKQLLAEDMRELMRCGINWPTVDMLNITDKRMMAAIWSWAPSYPKGEGQCAIYKYNEGIQNTPCNKVVISLICQEEGTHQLKAISFKGPWRKGESACQLIAGKYWHFATPINGQQMNTVKESMEEQAIHEAWLNYSIDEKGQWRANLQK